MAFYTTSATDSLWKRERFQIDAAQSVTTKNIPLSNFKAVKYIFSFASDDDSYYTEMAFINKNGNILSSQWGKTGKMKVTIDENVSSGVFNVVITNNETFKINLDAVSLTLNQ